MKKLNYFLLGAAGLVLTSCANEDLTGPGNPDGTANVTVNLSTPEINSRAYSNGRTANKLQYAVYMKNGDTLTRLDSYTHDSTNAETIDLKKQVSFQLVKGNTYTFVFWAGNSEAPYTIEFAQNGATMTVDYDGVLANTEELDAFYTHIEHTVNGDASVEAHLYRPFAQINVGTNDYAAAEAAGYTPTVSQIKVNNLYTTLDLLTDEVDDDTSVTFGYKEFNTTEDFPVKQLDAENKNKLQYMAMTYGLVDKDQANVEVYFDVMDGNKVVRGEHTVGSVPVRRNYRTNIYGALLTSQLDVNVVIEPAFEIPDFEFNVIAPGVQYDEESDTFTISSAEGLQWFSSQVNSQGGNPAVKTQTFNGYSSAKASFVDQTIVLENDIDMSGIDWTPIGYETNKDGASIYGFAGTFDGNNKTISNLKVRTEKDNNAGFFGATRQAVIKDLTLTDVDILGHYKTGAIVGDGVNAEIENCKVIGGSVVATPWEKTPGKWDDANNIGGIVGYLNGQPYKSSVKGCTVDGVLVKAYRKVGGIVGVVTTADDADPHTSGVEVTGNTVKNSTIIADMTEIRYGGFKNEDTYFETESRIGKVYGSKTENDRTNVANNTDTENNTVKILKPDAVVDSSSSLSDALNSVADGAVIVVNGDIEQQFTSLPSNKTYTIKGLGADVSTIVLDYTTATGSDITFEDITIRPIYNPTNHTACGLKGIKKATFNNVTLACEMATYTGDVTFNNCTILYNPQTDPKNEGRYGGYLYGGNVTFNDCVFDQTAALNTGSKAILIYPDGEMGDVTVNNCKFIGGPIPNAKGNAAVEIHTEKTTSAGTLTINNSTYDNKAYPGGLWREKNGNTNEATNIFTIYVDGKKVQPAE